MQQDLEFKKDDFVIWLEPGHKEYYYGRIMGYEEDHYQVFFFADELERNGELGDRSWWVTPDSLQKHFIHNITELELE